MSLHDMREDRHGTRYCGYCYDNDEESQFCGAPSEVVLWPCRYAVKICLCGRQMTENPHQDAGKPSKVLEVGAVWVCIPCTQKALSGWSSRAMRAERKLGEAMQLLSVFRFWEQQEHGVKEAAIRRYYDMLGEHLAGKN